jgi:hypothetical protein
MTIEKGMTIEKELQAENNNEKKEQRRLFIVDDEKMLS